MKRSMSISDIRWSGGFGCAIAAMSFAGTALRHGPDWWSFFGIILACVYGWWAWRFARLQIVLFPLKRLFVNGEEVRLAGRDQHEVGT